MTTDAASNMRKAMKESMVIDTHFRCLAHVINICVVKALEQETVAQSIQKCKALAAATHRSTQKNELLKRTAIAKGGKRNNFRYNTVQIRHFNLFAVILLNTFVNCCIFVILTETDKYYFVILRCTLS